MLGPVLLPQQQQRHAAAAQLGMHPAPVRQRLRRAGMKARRREQPPFQRGIVELVAGSARRARSPPPDGGIPPTVERPIAERPGDHPLADAAGVLQTKNFSNLAHRQSLGGHRTSLACLSEGTVPTSRSPTTLTPWRYSRWPACRGTGGRLAQESVAAFPRNDRPTCRGICSLRLSSIRWCGPAEAYRGIPADKVATAMITGRHGAHRPVHSHLCRHDGTLERCNDKAGCLREWLTSETVRIISDNPIYALRAPGRGSQHRRSGPVVRKGDMRASDSAFSRLVSVEQAAGG